MTIDETLNECRELLMNCQEVKNYFELKDQINNCEELHSLMKQIQYYQRQMTIYREDKEYHELHLQYLDLKKQYDNHPLIKNMEITHEQVYELLEQIKYIFEK